MDGNTDQLLTTQTISNFSRGEYLTWNLQGHVIISVQDDAGPNAVYSGIFFDTPTTQPNSFAGTDSATAAYNWRSRYGSQGAVVVGDTSQTPPYVSFVNAVGETGAVLRQHTRSGIAAKSQ